MSYNLNTSDPNLWQTSTDAAITDTSTNYNFGVVKAGGSDGDKLKTIDVVETDQSLYGSQLIVGPNATGFGDASGAVMTPNSNYIMSLINVTGDASQARLNETKAVNLVKTATAVRAGYWNIFSGEFTTPPSTGNNWAALTATGIGTDAEVQANSNGRGVKGQLTYAMPQAPVNDDYDQYSG